jgi:hypothetical protein
MTPDQEQGTKGDSGWVWYFVAVGVLAVLAVVVLAVYNLRLQLKPEQLEAARKLWEQKGPHDYRLKYTTKRGDETDEDVYVVVVRGGVTVSVLRNGRELEKRLRLSYGMSALLDDIEDFLKRDSQKGRPRTYTRALFDPGDGHLVHYVRRVMGSRERVEISVQSLEPLPEGGRSKK